MITVCLLFSTDTRQL